MSKYNGVKFIQMHKENSFTVKVADDGSSASAVVIGDPEQLKPMQDANTLDEWINDVYEKIDDDLMSLGVSKK